MIIRFTLFFKQLPSDISGSRTSSGTCDISGFHSSLVYISGKVSSTTSLNYPACYGRYSEVPHDADNHKDDVHGITRIGYVGRVSQHLYILFDNQGLDFSKH